MSKYKPLRDHLQSLRHNGDKIWNATFAQIENILGFPLPKSAYEYEVWWNNEDADATAHVQCRSWINAGWKVEKVNIINRNVLFRQEAA